MKLTKSNYHKNITTILSRWGFSKQCIFLNTKGEWYLFSQMLIIILHLISPYPKIKKIESSINT